MIETDLVVVRIGPRAYASFTWNYHMFSVDITFDPIDAQPCSSKGAEYLIAKLTKSQFYHWFNSNLTLVDDAKVISVEKARACGCCGKTHRCREDFTLANTTHGLRCEKHKGRNPCIIQGCGKTFAGDPGEEVICGRHWRDLVPKRWREFHRRIWKKGKRLDWPPHLCRQADRVWGYCRKMALDGGRLDETEINKLFGWGE